mmetsp:Transcript_13559/g.16438  ORF Transcript_13559/g.16438 Transcript_13559/m.16438 type:complete len:282 (-) Transcript_13559:112-957(-)
MTQFGNALSSTKLPELECKTESIIIAEGSLIDSLDSELQSIRNRHIFSSTEQSAIQNLGHWAISSIQSFGEKPEFDLGSCYEEMGIAKAKCGNIIEALCLFDLALQAKRETYGKDNIALISTLLNRARMFEKTDLIRSCSEYREVINIKERSRTLPCIPSSKEDDIFLSKILLELGHVQHKRRNFYYAIQSFVSALNIQVAYLGTQHDDVGYTHFLIGRTHHLNKDYEEAMKSYRNSLHIFSSFGQMKKKHAIIQIIQRLMSDRTMLADISSKHWEDDHTV